MEKEEEIRKQLMHLQKEYEKKKRKLKKSKRLAAASTYVKNKIQSTSDLSVNDDFVEQSSCVKKDEKLHVSFDGPTENNAEKMAEKTIDNKSNSNKLRRLSLNKTHADENFGGNVRSLKVVEKEHVKRDTLRILRKRRSPIMQRYVGQRSQRGQSQRENITSSKNRETCSYSDPGPIRGWDSTIDKNTVWPKLQKNSPLLSSHKQVLFFSLPDVEFAELKLKKTQSSAHSSQKLKIRTRKNVGAARISMEKKKGKITVTSPRKEIEQSQNLFTQTSLNDDNNFPKCFLEKNTVSKEVQKSDIVVENFETKSSPISAVCVHNISDVTKEYEAESESVGSQATPPVDAHLPHQEHQNKSQHFNSVPFCHKIGNIAYDDIALIKQESGFYLTGFKDQKVWIWKEITSNYQLVTTQNIMDLEENDKITTVQYFPSDNMITLLLTTHHQSVLVFKYDEVMQQTHQRILQKDMKDNETLLLPCLILSGQRVCVTSVTCEATNIKKYSLSADYEACDSVQSFEGIEESVSSISLVENLPECVMGIKNRKLVFWFAQTGQLVQEVSLDQDLGKFNCLQAMDDQGILYLTMITKNRQNHRKTFGYLLAVNPITGWSHVIHDLEMTSSNNQTLSVYNQTQNQICALTKNMTFFVWCKYTGEVVAKLDDINLCEMCIATTSENFIALVGMGKGEAHLHVYNI